jgi:hypothetical protein
MNNISEKFLDYLQGNLNVSEESELFSILSYDEEMRNEFKNFLTIEKSLRKSSMSFMPPANVTNLIFTQLGVNSYNPQLGENANKLTSASFINGKYFPSIITGLVSIIATVLIMLNLMNSSNDSSKNNMLENNLTFDKQINNSNSNVEKRQKSEIRRKSPIIERGSLVSFDSIPDFKDDKKDLITVNSNIQAISFSNQDLLNKQVSFPAYIKKTLVPIKDNEYSSQSYLNIDQKYGFGIEIRGSASWNLPKETIYPSEISKLHNMDLFVYY